MTLIEYGPILNNFSGYVPDKLLIMVLNSLLDDSFQKYVSALCTLHFEGILYAIKFSSNLISSNEHQILETNELARPVDLLKTLKFTSNEI